MTAPHAQPMDLPPLRSSQMWLGEGEAVHGSSGDILSQPQHSDSEVESEDENELLHAGSYLSPPKHTSATSPPQAAWTPTATSTLSSSSSSSSSSFSSTAFSAPDLASAKDKGGSKDNYSHLVVFTAHKAGMDGAKMDQEQANKLIYELSKDSQYFKNAKRRDAKLDIRIEKLRKRIATSRPVSSPFMARLITRLEAQRNLNRIYVVIDVDMFFAAVAMRDNPSLRGKPIAVGGIGMISTANYEARKYRVRSAMPGFIAKRLCPNLIFVKSDWNAYKLAAKQMRDIFRQYDPNFSAGSLDEASLDITDYLCRLVEKDGGNIPEDEEERRYTLSSLADSVVAEIRERCKTATCGLTCSAGIAPSRFLAKIASDINKPNGQLNLGCTAGKIVRFMSDLPVRKVPGVGRVTARVLKELLHINTCGDLFAARKRVATPGLFNERTRNWLLRACLGIASQSQDQVDHSKTLGIRRKGISKETTFQGVSKLADLVHICENIAAGLAKDMTKEKLKARTLTLKLKTADFEVITRAKTLLAGSFVSSARGIFEVAKTLLIREHKTSLNGRPVRLLGIRCSKFIGAAVDVGKGQTRLSFPTKSSETAADSNTPNVAASASGQASEKAIVLASGPSSRLATTHAKLQSQALQSGSIDESVLSQLPAEIQDELLCARAESTSRVEIGSTKRPFSIKSSLLRAVRRAPPQKKRSRSVQNTNGDPSNDQVRALRSGKVDSAVLASLPAEIRKELENSMRYGSSLGNRKKRAKRSTISDFFKEK